MIKRLIYNQIQDKLFKCKAIIITGPRQTGKTTILKTISDEKSKKALFLDCDDTLVRKKLTDQSIQSIGILISGYEIVIIDEAQRVENIGLTLKIITDNFSNIQLIVSGSSSLDILSKVNEPLTGRKWEYNLFPISFSEMVNHTSILDELSLLKNRLIYGYYPDVVNNKGNEIEILRNLTTSYLYKDIFSSAEIRKPDVIERLLEALALQLCNEVSTNELSRLLGIDNATVERYLLMLEKCFVIFSLRSLSRNLRTELKKSKKYYFYDNGIRNSIISNFNPVELRNDTGALWENFVVSERMKFIKYNNVYCNRYFWRTLQQQEIDYIEDSGGKINAFEIKWNPRSKAKVPITFIKAYPDSDFRLITPDNFTDIISIKV